MSGAGDRERRVLGAVRDFLAGRVRAVDGRGGDANPEADRRGVRGAGGDVAGEGQAEARGEAGRARPP